MTSEGATDDTGRWLPDDAKLIALVRDADGDAWAVGMAAGLADLVGRARGRTYLANVAGAPELDRGQGVVGGPGLTSALTGTASVASIARASPGGRFVYLPAGEAPLPFAGLRRMQKFRRFLAQVKEGGGTLLLYVGTEDLAASDQGTGRVPPLPLDGCIALGEARGMAAALGAPLLARVERPASPPPPTPSPGSAVGQPRRPVEAETGRGAGGRASPASRPLGSRRPAPGSVTRLLIPIAALALLWVGWAVIGSPAASMPDPGTAAERSAGDAQSGGAATSSASEPAPAVQRSFDAPAARYSVLVASYIRLSDAMSRRAELAEDGGLFYVAPTPVRSRVYYRVLAGVHEDLADAAALMSALVADGRKEMEKDWDLRPVRLAYDLGTFAERDSADSRANRLRAADIPAYVLRDTAEAPLYRVYAGAYTSEEDAAPLGRRLEAEGEGAELITRSGVAP